MDKSIVARATSNDDSPTPGYLYGDIASMTHANFEGSRQLTVYLLERIKKPNHNIKFKCLQIIKHVCMKGRADFKLTMQRESQTIKDCLTFSGPPDPLRGEEIYRKVREAAKECLEAVFAENLAPGASAQPRYASGNRIEGFGSAGSNASPTGAYGYSGSGGGGYGNGAPGYGNGGGMYPYDGYSAGGGAGYPPGRTASGSIEAVSTAVGAAVGKAMGTLRGRATSARGVGLVAEGGGYVGGGASAGGMPRSSGMVGMGNYDPSKDKTWLERTSETVKDSVGTGIASMQRRLGGSGSGDSRYQSHNGEQMNFPASQYMNNRGTNAYRGGSYQAEAVSSAYEDARASSQAYASQWKPSPPSGPLPPSSFPVVNGGVRGVWGGQGAQRPGASTGHEYGGGSGGGGSGGNPGGAAAAAAEADSAERDFVGRTGGGDTDGGYEGKLVEEICAAGGTKSTPGKQELEAFLSKAVSLDPAKIAGALLVALGAVDWRARSKALAVVEALHRSDPSYRIPLEDALNNPEEGVIPLCADSKPAVRDRAVRVAKHLGLDISSVTIGPAAQDDKCNSEDLGYATAPDGEEDEVRVKVDGTTSAAPTGPPVDLLGDDFDAGTNGTGDDTSNTAVADILGVDDTSSAIKNNGVSSPVSLLSGVDGGQSNSGLDDILGLGGGGGGGGGGGAGSGAEGRPASIPKRGQGGGGTTSSSEPFVQGGSSSTDGDGEGDVDASASLFGDLAVKNTSVSGKDGGGLEQGPTDRASDARPPSPSPPPPRSSPKAETRETSSSGFSFMFKGESTGSDPPAPSGGDLLSGFGRDAAALTSAEGGGGSLLVMSPETPEVQIDGTNSVGHQKQPSAASTATKNDDWLGLDPLATSAPVSQGEQGGVTAVANSVSGLLLDWSGSSKPAVPAASSGGVAGMSSLLRGDFSSYSAGAASGPGVGPGVSPEFLKLQRENELLQQKVMMMQQSGAMVGGAGGIASPFVSNSAAGVGGGGGFVGSTSPPLMRPQSSLPHAQPLSGVLGVGTEGAGMMRSGAGVGKTIPDAALWGGGAQAQRGQGGGSGSGFGVGPGQQQHLAQQLQEAQKAPDSFSFVRDAMDDLIK